MRSLMLSLFVAIALTLPAGSLQAQQREPTVYLPLVRGAAVAPPAAQAAYRVHAPYFAVDSLDGKLGEMAIFWFGKVTPEQNYADVRVGYNDRELVVYLAVFDRRLWYDVNPKADTLTAWDAATLFLEPAAGAGGQATRYRFVGALGQGNFSAYQAVYSLSATGWAPAPVAFAVTPGWRGDALNNDGDDRGWVITFRIPFASLGLGARPADGAVWRMALALHDRDDAAGSPIATQLWPPSLAPEATRTWGALEFGLPSYAPPATTDTATVTIRQGLSGNVVSDAAVGGGAVCGEGLDFWRQWGESTREAGKPDFNIQNQLDVADWPCFSKYFVTFPLDRLPPGRAVVSARLLLHQFGNAEPATAKPSFIQALTVGEDWSEDSLTWNNAPLATANYAGTWVAPLSSFPGWPGVQRELDVSASVAEAYAANRPLRLALYSADGDYHSGKYFVSSDSGDWNAAGRPTLIVVVGTRRPT